MTNTFVSTAQQPRSAGRAEDKAEGKAEGKTATLLRLLTRRFGAPAAAVAERIRSATGDELDRWTDRILDARSLDELFAD